MKSSLQVGSGFLASLLLLAVTLGTGCGSKSSQVPVRGEVRFRGSPIPLGKIVFSPDTTRGNSGPQGFAAIENGRFDTSAKTGRGSVPGPVVIKVEAYEASPLGGDAFLGKALFSKPYQQDLIITDTRQNRPQ